MPRVVVVGLGPGGLGALQTFASKLSPCGGVEVVVFEKSEYYYHTFGVARTLTEAEYDKHMFIPYDNVIPPKAQGFIRFQRAVVTGIAADSNMVNYASIGADNKASQMSQTMAFDYLILATGSTYTVPIKHDPNVFSRANMQQKIAEVREHIAKSEKILVVGGGAVGCEVAAYIASKYPDKKIILASSSTALVAGVNVNDTFRTSVFDALVALNVEVLLDERLEERLTANVFEKRTLRTTKGTLIESDIQLLCAGFSPASELVAGLDGSIVDEKAAIKVNDKLQLDHPKYPHVVAVGDATNHERCKLGKGAYLQAAHVAGGIVGLVQNKQTELQPFAVPTMGMALPLGPNGGVSQLPIFGGWVLGDWFTWLVSSRDMGAW